MGGEQFSYLRSQWDDGGCQAGTRNLGFLSTMFSSAIRSSLRSSSRLTARSAAPNRVSAFRSSGFRKYSTEAPKSSSNGLLWAGVGAAAVGGVAWYLYSSDDAVKGAETALKSGVQSAKVAANFVPTKADYQKVCLSHRMFACHGRMRFPRGILGLLQDCRTFGRC